VEIYIPHDHRIRKCVDHILEQKTMHQASLFIPNFCIAEVFNTFARKHFDPNDRDSALDADGYERCLSSFRSHIHWGSKIYPYDLNRYHIVAADKIIPAEHKRQRKDEKDHLSTFDILIIAMACEMAWIGEREDTYLVTCDKRLKQVCDDLRTGDFSELLVEGPLGKLDENRWVPPKCLYLPNVTRGEMRNFRGQALLNI
jgi:hypothetical protein